MKVAQLDMGCSHVAVLLKKEEGLMEYIRKEENKKEKEIIKPKKRKRDYDKENENEDNINIVNEIEKDKSEKVKAFIIREEFITLNVRDKPKVFKILKNK